jgi:hypothetical protein
MNLTRRIFLGGTLAIAATKFVFAEENLPTLYGDGIQDDTIALQTLFDGGKIRLANQGTYLCGINPHHISLTGGRYIISKPLYIGGEKRPFLELKNLHITASKPLEYAFNYEMSLRSLADFHYTTEVYEQGKIVYTGNIFERQS